jgi:hypothetical protein
VMAQPSWHSATTDGPDVSGLRQANIGQALNAKIL